MTTPGPFRLTRRRWPVFAAGLLVACALVIGIAGQPPVHVAEAEVTFRPPDSVLRTTPYEGYVDTMIAFTGAVSATYNQRYSSTTLSSPRATLFGNGLREGVTVHPSMTGNQWRVGFDRPVVVVTVSASTEEGALATLHQQMERLEDVAAGLQDDVGVGSSLRIVSVWSAREIKVDSFGPTPPSTARGAGVLVGIVVLFFGLVSAALDRSRKRRGGPGQGSSDQAGPALLRAGGQ